MICGGEPASIVFGVVIVIWSDRDNTKWIDMSVRCIVVKLYVLHIDRFLDFWHLVDLTKVLEANENQTGR